MAVRQCRVSFATLDGVTHSVLVTAETAFEAIAEAIAVFEESACQAQITMATKFDVEVFQLRQQHEKIAIERVRKWSAPRAADPVNLKQRKERVRELVGSTGEPIDFRDRHWRRKLDYRP